MTAQNPHPTWDCTLLELVDYLGLLGGSMQQRSRWRSILRDIGPGTQIKDLSTATLSRWVMQQRQHLGPGTINRRSQSLRAALKQASMLGLIDSCPSVITLKEPPARDRICSPAELRELLRNMRGPTRLAVQLAYHTGMRRGEICSLMWGQIDLAARMIRLDASQTKTRRPRSVPIPAALHGVLVCAQKPPAARVLPITPNGVTCTWLRAVKRAGIEGLRFHDLRHTHLTRLRRAGVDVFTLSAIAGHSNIASAARYQTILESDLAVAAGKLDG